MAAVDRIVAVAGERLAPSLATDELLRANLTEHLRRLAVRLRYGLPVSNPLHQEVRKRYGDVYEVARAMVAEQGVLAVVPHNVVDRTRALCSGWGV